MIKTQTKIEIVTLSVPCLGHLFGLFLLLRTSFPGFNGLFQKMFFINLCLSEVVIIFLATVKRLTHADTYSTITLFQYMVGHILMYEVMIIITLERLNTLNINSSIFLSMFFRDTTAQEGRKQKL